VVVALGALGIALAAAVVIATAPHGDTGDALHEPAGETAT